MAKKILEDKMYCEKCGEHMIYNNLLDPMVSYREVYHCPNMCSIVDTNEIEGKVLAAIRKNLFSMKRLIKIVEDAKLCYGDMIADISIKNADIKGQIMFIEQTLKTRRRLGQKINTDLFLRLEDLQSELEKNERFLKTQLNDADLEYSTAQKFMLINLSRKEKLSLINKHVNKIMCTSNGCYVYYALDNTPKAI